MKKHYRASVRAEALSPRTILHRLVLAALVGTSMLLLLNAREPEGRARALESAITDAAAPIVEAAGNPMQSIRSGIASMQQFFAANEENKQLRLEVEELRALKIEASELRTENAELRKQLGAMPQLASHFLTARMLTDHRGNFRHSAIINAGSIHGVATGQAVVSADGVVGRVLQVGKTSSRVLFLTDSYSKIPVVTQRSGQQAIVAGNNDDLPTLRFVASMKGLEVGEKLFTSGAGGMFPRGLPVGVVREIRPDGTVRVRPLAPLHSISYVSVIQQPAIAEPEEMVAPVAGAPAPSATPSHTGAASTSPAAPAAAAMPAPTPAR